MKNMRYKGTLSLGIAVLLFASQWVALAEDKKSPIKIGGAMRVGWARGSYTSVYNDESSIGGVNSHPRSRKIGDVDLEIFRLNADLDYQNVISRLEYRWYDGYSMIHTAWLGYNLGELGTVKAGIVRVPFGPGPYGVSSSWFFDQHFYVGLADDMDLGIRWSDTLGKLTLDAGYFLQPEFQTDGSSVASSRYSYDIVRWAEKADANGDVEWEDVDPTDGRTKKEREAISKARKKNSNGFDEQHQLNLRAIYTLDKVADVGVSLQYGLLKGKNVDDDGANHYALSAHMKNTFSDFTLFSQFSYYAYNIADETPWGTGDLIPMGAYDFAWPIASKGLIPALSLRYGGIDTSGISWIDSLTPYVEASTILKTVDDFNNSTLVTLGASWTVLGALYIYSDLALSNGNGFVGNVAGDVEDYYADGAKKDYAEDYANIYTGAGDYGANGNDAWNWRININFGYYF